MPDKPGAAFSRREFARRAAIASAIGSAVVSIAPASAVGAELAVPAAQGPPPANPGPASASAPLAPNVPTLSPESQAEADARYQTILAQYGSRFSDEQKTDLQRLCAVVQPQLDRLRAYPIRNGDGTALYLKPLFEREKKPKAPGVSPRDISQPGSSKPGAAKPGPSPAAHGSGAAAKS